MAAAEFQAAQQVPAGTAADSRWSHGRRPQQAHLAVAFQPDGAFPLYREMLNAAACVSQQGA